jgi:hypothetical protein
MLLATCSALLGCSTEPQGKTYALPYEQAYSRLYGMGMTREVCQQDYGVSNAGVRMDKRTADEISWVVSSRGKDRYELSTKLLPAPEGQTGTQVIVSTNAIVTNDGSMDSGGEEGLGKVEASALFAEKVDSTLEGRPFELRRVTAAIDKYLNRSAQGGGSQQSAAIESGMASAERMVDDFGKGSSKPRGNAPGERAIC